MPICSCTAAIWRSAAAISGRRSSSAEGTATGTGIGLGFSWALVRAMHGKGISQLAIPVQELTVIIVLAAVEAVAAAALPARPASRHDVLKATTA